MKEIIQRIPQHFVREDLGCAQVFLKFQSSLTLFDKDGILFNRDGRYECINKFLDDNRRFEFPYGNIPCHVSRYQLFGKNNVTNQLLNFNESYISIVDGRLVERFVVPYRQEALMSVKTYNLDTTEESACDVRVLYMSRKELDTMFRMIDSNKKVFIVSDDGDVYHSHDMGYINEEQMVLRMKQRWISQFETCKKNMTTLEDEAIAFIDNKLQNMTVDDIFEHYLTPMIYLVKMDGNEISVDMINTMVVRSNYYRVTIKSVPLTKCTFEQLRLMTYQIKNIGEPKISCGLNPGVDRSEVVSAKKRIREFYKR